MKMNKAKRKCFGFSKKKNENEKLVVARAILKNKEHWLT